MDPELTAYATVLLTGTGTSVTELQALTRAEQEPHTAAAAAVLDGWRSAQEGKQP